MIAALQLTPQAFNEYTPRMHGSLLLPCLQQCMKLQADRWADCQQIGKCFQGTTVLESLGMAVGHVGHALQPTPVQDRKLVLTLQPHIIHR